MVQVQVEFLMTHESYVYSISRVPCVGEFVYNVDDDVANEVKQVMHAMNSDPEAVVAIIRVK